MRSAASAAVALLLAMLFLQQGEAQDQCPDGAVALLYNNGTGYAVQCYLYLQGRYSYEERQERSETSRTDFGNYYYEWKQRQPTMRIVDSGATVDCSGSVYDEYDYQYCNAAGCYGDTLTGRQDKQSSCTTYRFYAFPGNVFAWVFGNVSDLQTFVQLVRNTNDSKEITLNWGGFTSFDRKYYSTDTILIQDMTRLGDASPSTLLQPSPPQLSSPLESTPPPLTLPQPLNGSTSPLPDASQPPPQPLPQPPSPVQNPPPLDPPTSQSPSLLNNPLPQPGSPAPSGNPPPSPPPKATIPPSPRISLPYKLFIIRKKDRKSRRHLL